MAKPLTPEQRERKAAYMREYMRTYRGARPPALKTPALRAAHGERMVAWWARKKAADAAGGHCDPSIGRVQAGLSNQGPYAIAPAHVLAAREQRQAQELTLHQVLLGDPPPGRSALDQRMQRGE